MNRRRWFLHFLKCSLGQRKARVAVASLSVIIAAAIVVSAVGLSLGIRDKLGGELKAYGANVMITPEEGYLGEEALLHLTGANGVEGYSGQLYSAVSVNGAEVELIGVDMGWLRQQGWKVEGGWPAGGQVLVGSDIRDAFGLKEGDMVTLGLGGTEVKAAVSGFVERGGPEDGAVLMDLGRAQEQAGLSGSLSAVLVRAVPGNIDATVALLGEKIPGARVKTLRQVAFAEESFLGKIELLMVLVTIVVLLTSAISVSSTMSATVLERMKEIGLMMALGGTKRGIKLFYLAEGCIIGLAGGLVGYVVGYVAAQAVSRGAFSSFIGVPLYVLPLALLLGVLLAVLASFMPVSNALRNRPSDILRGE